MKEKITEISKKQIADFEGKKISRKEAIKKTGYMAASAATMMILLSSPKAHAGSSCEDDKGSHHGSDHSGHHGGH